MSWVTIGVLALAAWTLSVTVICMFLRSASIVNERYDQVNDDTGY